MLSSTPFHKAASREYIEFTPMGANKVAILIPGNNWVLKHIKKVEYTYTAWKKTQNAENLLICMCEEVPHTNICSHDWRVLITIVQDMHSPTNKCVMPMIQIIYDKAWLVIALLILWLCMHLIQYLLLLLVLLLDQVLQAFILALVGMAQLVGGHMMVLLVAQPLNNEFLSPSLQYQLYESKVTFLLPLVSCTCVHIHLYYPHHLVVLCLSCCRIY